MSWTATKHVWTSKWLLRNGFIIFFKAEKACGLRVVTQDYTQHSSLEKAKDRVRDFFTLSQKGYFSSVTTTLPKFFFLWSKMKHSSFLTYCHTESLVWNIMCWFNRVIVRLQQEASVSVTMDFNLISLRKHSLNSAVLPAQSSNVLCTDDQP